MLPDGYAETIHENGEYLNGSTVRQVSFQETS